MNKRNIRSFSLGMFITVSLIGSFYLFFNKNEVITDKEAENHLKESGYVVLSKEEYNQLEVKTNLSTEQNTSDEKESVKEIQTIEKENEESDDSPKSYQLYINAGMTISQITEQLEEAEIIQDRNDFENYLIKNKYHTKVQLGKFKLTSDMSYKQIAVELTK